MPLDLSRHAVETRLTVAQWRALLSSTTYLVPVLVGNKHARENERRKSQIADIEASITKYSEIRAVLRARRLIR